MWNPASTRPRCISWYQSKARFLPWHKEEHVGGRPVAIDDMYERDEVARDAQLEAFFQRTEEWFDMLSKQLTALTIENRPQNYHPNSRYVGGEYFDVEEEDYNIKKEDEYIERVCVVNWDSPTIIGWYNQFVQ